MDVKPFRARRDQQQKVAQLRWAVKLAREDLALMGERLEQVPAAEEWVALAEHQCANELYTAARADLREAQDVDDVLVIQNSLCQAWFHMARGEALGRGEEPPTRSDPCHFNPQHGPAVTEVVWAAHGAPPTSVAVCSDDAERIESGLAPKFRQVGVGDRIVAWHEARDGSMPIEYRKERQPDIGGYAGVYDLLAKL